MKPIFVNNKLALINNKSNQIVSAISNNYQALIHGMDKQERTKEQYLKTVAPFLAFIQANGISNQSFRDFKNALRDNDKIKPSTKNGYLAATKALLKEAHKHGFLPVDITANVSQFKIEKGHVKDGLQSIDVKKVLQYISGIKKPATRFKSLALFYLFAFEGFRQMEAANLLVSDVSLNDGQVLVRGKGSDSKKAHQLTGATVEALAAWLEFSGLETGYLFPSTKYPDKPITERAIRKMFTHPQYGYFKKAGVETRSVHGFRHFNVTETLNTFGGDLHRTMKRARLKSVQTVQSYDDRRTNKIDVLNVETHLTNLLTHQQ